MTSSGRGAAGRRGAGAAGRAAIAALLPILAALGACGGGPVGGERPAPGQDVPRAALEKLAGKRIYFGHQSVGYDLVGGLQSLAREEPEVRLAFVEGRSAEALAAPAFAHAPNGRNRDPLGKIRDFAATVEGGVGASADVAFFKFCYVDFGPATDVAAVFGEYRDTMARLRSSYPGVRFVHVTAPLTVVQSGPKAFVKRLLGKSPYGAAENVARERFNALLRAEYGGREPLFDLAAVEATRPDGRELTFPEGGARVRALVEEYATDGAHLNAAGARRAAAKLVEVLAAAVE